MGPGGSLLELFLVDENLPVSSVQMAVERGHRAEWSRDVMPGASDAATLGRVRASGAALVTRDVRFANTVLASMSVEGRSGLVMLIREQSLPRVERAWLRFPDSPRDLKGIAALTAQRVRYRHAPPTA